MTLPTRATLSRAALMFRTLERQACDATDQPRSSIGQFTGGSGAGAAAEHAASPGAHFSAKSYHQDAAVKIAAARGAAAAVNAHVAAAKAHATAAVSPRSEEHTS